MKLHFHDEKRFRPATKYVEEELHAAIVPYFNFLGTYSITRQLDKFNGRLEKMKAHLTYYTHVTFKQPQLTKKMEEQLYGTRPIKCRNFPDDDDVTRNYKKDPHGIRSTAKSSSSMNRGKGDDDGLNLKLSLSFSLAHSPSFSFNVIVGG